MNAPAHPFAAASADLAGFVQMLHKMAAAVDGKLILSSFGENPETGRALPAKHAHFAPGDVAGMMAQAERWNAEPHRNVYAATSAMVPQLHTGLKGSEADVAAVLALVCDFDAKDDPNAANYAARLPLPPNAVIETSPGSYQAFYILAEPSTKDAAKPIAEKLANFAGCDKVSKDVSHVWRVAGTLNYPNRKKLEAGRSREPFAARFVKPWDGKSRTRLANLAAALSQSLPPAPTMPAPKSAPGSEFPAAAATPRPEPKAIPADLRCRIEQPPEPHEDRSETAFRVVRDLDALGYDAETIVGLFLANPGGVGQRYAGDEKRIRGDVARILDKSTPDYVHDMNARYFVANDGGQCVVYRPVRDEHMKRWNYERSTFEDLRRLYANRKVQVGEKDGAPVLRNMAAAWQEHPQRRDYLGGIVFAPGKIVPPDQFNLWQGFAVEPIAGDWSLMREHIRRVICGGDGAIFEYLLNWLSRCVQEPSTPGETAIVLRGGQGTGKGILGRAMLRLLGQHGLHITHAKHLTGQFNGHLRDCVFLFADEAFFAGDRSHEGVLKGLITEPTITVESKYKNAVSMPNMTHIVMASNEEWVVPAGKDDRRFLVLDVENEHQQNAAYFDPIFDQLEAGGYAAMLFDLLARDLSRFNVRRVPKTKAHAEQKAMSLRGVDRWLYDRLQRGQLHASTWGADGVEISKNEAYADYEQWHRNSGEFRAAALLAWAKTLWAALGGNVSNYRRNRSGTREQWFRFAGLAQCRSAFAAYLNAAGLDWGDEGDTDSGHLQAEERIEGKADDLFA